MSEAKTLFDPYSAGRPEQESNLLPAKVWVFFLADEWDPTRKKLVRKVAFPTDLADSPELVERIINPQKFGLFPRAPDSPVTLGRHVTGMTNSRYVSTSRLAFGSPRFVGERFWIDEQKLKEAGVKVYDARDILADLDRIALNNARKPDFVAYLQDIKRKSSIVDREAVIDGAIPARYIKGRGSMALTKGLQFLQGVGIVITAYDLEQASVRSVQLNSVRPIAAEVTRQAGGWGAAMAGARIGMALGGLVGIETGPGAVLTAAAGGVLFGAAGYFGASWFAEYIDEPVRDRSRRPNVRPSGPYLRFEDWDKRR